jgi:hypothetical protein
VARIGRSGGGTVDGEVGRGLSPAVDWEVGSGPQPCCLRRRAALLVNSDMHCLW